MRLAVAVVDGVAEDVGDVAGDGVGLGSAEGLVDGVLPLEMLGANDDEGEEDGVIDAEG